MKKLIVPEVSVVIPTYNRAHLIARALESVFAQTQVSFEVLVVDDGSTDQTNMVVEALFKTNSDVSARLIRQDNQGPSAARNRGIRDSRAPLIAFLDSDDQWAPGKLHAHLAYMKAHPQLLISQTDEIWIRNGRRVNPKKKHEKKGGIIFKECLALCLVSPSSVVMRRSFFDEVGFFDESLPACEDYDLWLRASARMPIGLLKKPLTIKYGGHEDQLSRTCQIMDQYRIRSLETLLSTDVLNLDQTAWAQAELNRKRQIVARGARKRKLSSPFFT